LVAMVKRVKVCHLAKLCGDLSNRYGDIAILGRPFVKWFALCYRTVVCPICLSVLSVTLVYCGQTVG